MPLAFPKPHRIRDPKALALYKRAHPWCEACAKRRTEEVHHLVSRARGGSDVPENLLALDARCHREWTGVNRTRRAWFLKHAATMTDEARAKVRAALGITEKEPLNRATRPRCKTATYTRDGTPFTVEYDPDAPCMLCGFPVIEASMGGTAVCPWCDCGSERPEVAAARRKALER